MSTGFYMRALESVAAKMERNYQRGTAAASSIRIALHGEECYRHSVGYADIEAKKPVEKDTIFRLYSMSKPITMTALMQLYERGLVYLEDPLESFIPEFKDMPVAVAQPDGSVQYEKQTTPITVKNLCTMTSGISYPSTDDPGARAMQKVLESHEGETYSTVEVVKLAAKEAALSFQPGARWKYGFSHDVVGALVEVISGQRYGDYLREHIFDPLQMGDTDFWVPEDKQKRFCHACEYKDGAYAHITDDEFNAQYMSRPAFESGGGGLVSTIDDYAHFCQMMVDGGKWNGERILGRKTIAMMAASQLTDEQHRTFSWENRGYGYAIGMRTHLKPWLINGSVGEFGWDGMMGAWMVIDPVEDMTVVYLQNMMPYNNNGMRLMPVIYGAME